VLLPSGTTLARLDAGLCAALLAAASEGHLPGTALGPAHDRGRSALPPEAQAAESFVRHQLGETSLGVLTARPLGPAEGPPARPLGPLEGRPEGPAEGAPEGPSEGGGESAVQVTHVDGRQWQVAARLEASDNQALPESCGKAAIATREWHLRLV
jgi:hypothetical protein